MKIFKRNNLQETVETEIDIDAIAEAEIIQETTTEIVVEITIKTEVEIATGIEVETVEITAEIETEAEVEIGLLQGMEEENPNLDQAKDTLTRMTSATTAI